MAQEKVIFKIEDTSSYFVGLAVDSSTGFSSVAAQMQPTMAKAFTKGTYEYKDAIATLTDSGLTFTEILIK